MFVTSALRRLRNAWERTRYDTLSDRYVCPSGRHDSDEEYELTCDCGGAGAPAPAPPPDRDQLFGWVRS